MNLVWLCLALASAASAQEAPPPGPVVVIPTEEAPAPELPASRVQWSPYWEPIGNYSVYTIGGAVQGGLSLGAMGGVRYRDTLTPLAGRTRAAASVLFLGSGIGWDARLGSFAGPAQKYWSVQAGPDLFYNAVLTSWGGLEPSVGVDLQLIGTLGPEQVYLVGGVIPALLLNPDRRVDWDEVGRAGVGHEFEWLVGLVVQTEAFSGGITYRRRIIADGVSQGFGFSVGF